MASLISQIRNGTPQQQQFPMQQQLDQSIEQTRALMQMVQGAQDPQAMLAQILSSNPNTPMIANLLKNKGSLESIAKQMAQTNGYDINQIITRLSGGT